MRLKCGESGEADKYISSFTFLSPLSLQPYGTILEPYRQVRALGSKVKAGFNRL